MDFLGALRLKSDFNQATEAHLAAGSSLAAPAAGWRPAAPPGFYPASSASYNIRQAELCSRQTSRF